eukprot:6760452-Alexandrium_andersonii.AAC.1
MNDMCCEVPPQRTASSPTVNRQQCTIAQLCAIALCCIILHNAVSCSFPHQGSLLGSCNMRNLPDWLSMVVENGAQLCYRALSAVCRWWLGTGTLVK